MEHNAKLVLKTDQFLILDDFCPPELLQEMWRVIRVEGYAAAPVVGHLSANWKIDGQLAYSSQAAIHSEVDKNSWASIIGDYFKFVADSYPNLVGKGWSDIRIHAQVYGRGTRIKLHFDSHSLGSFTYYPHPEWSPSWGGDLFVPIGVPLYKDLPIKQPKGIGREWDDVFLKNGLGYSISPKPNRCVLVAPGVSHSVSRVDPDCGDAMRFSVVGFLITEEDKKREKE